MPVDGILPLSTAKARGWDPVVSQASATTAGDRLRCITRRARWVDLPGGFVAAVATMNMLEAGPGNNRIVLRGLPRRPFMDTIDQITVIGTFLYLDLGANWYQGAVASTQGDTDGRVRFMVTSGTGWMGQATPALTIAAGDLLSVNLLYEAQ